MFYAMLCGFFKILSYQCRVPKKYTIGEFDTHLMIFLKSPNNIGFMFGMSVMHDPQSSRSIYLIKGGFYEVFLIVLWLVTDSSIMLYTGFYGIILFVLWLETTSVIYDFSFFIFPYLWCSLYNIITRT